MVKLDFYEGVGETIHPLGNYTVVFDVLDSYKRVNSKKKGSVSNKTLKAATESSKNNKSVGRIISNSTKSVNKLITRDSYMRNFL